MRFDVVTLFPEAFSSYLDASIVGRAQKRGLVSVHFTNPRQFVKDRHKTVDDRPYGGGAGMVMKAEPLLKSVASIVKKRTKRTHIVVLSAKGKPFDQKTAMHWAKDFDRIVFVSGRYEGIDERVTTALHAEEISIGPFVLTDGDVAVMAIISSVTRLLPGAIRYDSLQEESFWDALLQREAATGQLEYPHYTRPEAFTWKGKAYRVPKVLLSGDHKKIGAWRASKRKKT